MRDQTPKRPRRLAAAAAITLAMVLALGVGGARAEDDDENVPLDTKLWRQFMKDLGLQRDGEAMIDYRERAPLVVPPSRNLPPPRSEDEVTAKTAAWPKDPDVKRAKDYAAAGRTRQARPRGERQRRQGRRQDPRGIVPSADALRARHQNEEIVRLDHVVLHTGAAGSRAVHRRADTRQHDRPARRLSDAVSQLSLRGRRAGQARQGVDARGADGTQALTRNLPRQRAPYTFDRKRLRLALAFCGRNVH